MKIIISNRIDNLPNETIDNADINLTGLITALWETPETNRSKLSSFMHKGKPLDAEKIKAMLVVSDYNTLKSIDAKKIYPRRLHSVSLKSNLHWEEIQIDETSYLKYREQNPSFLPNLIKQHIKSNHTKKSTPSVSIPEFMKESPLFTNTSRRLRPKAEVNPAYPAPPTPHFEPEIDISDSARSELPEISETPKSEPQKTKKHTKKIMLLSLIMGIGIGAAAFVLFNLSIIASILCATITSAATFIITNHTLNKPLKSNLPVTPPPTPKEQEIIEAEKPVEPLLSPKNKMKKADKKKEETTKNTSDNKNKKMPAKPSRTILGLKTLSKQTSTVFESSEDSEESEILEEILPKRLNKRR